MRSTGVDLFAGVCTTGCLDRRVRGFLITSFLLCPAGDVGELEDIILQKNKGEDMFRRLTIP